MTTVALIPAFQPTAGLIDVLEGLRRRHIDRVVVDDGSGESYRGIFRRATREAIVLTYRANRGKGHALKLGLRYIQEHYPPDTVVVTVDADGQHRTDDALRCAQMAAKNPHALVLGCRDFDGEHVPLRSKLGNRITRVVFGLTSGRWLRDTQTGLRAFTADLISFFTEVGGERYEYEMNVLFACPEHEVDIREVAIQTIYENGNASSHFRPVRDSLLIYGDFLSFMAVSLASFAVDFTLFGVLAAVLAGMGVWGVSAANLLARLGSATMNFCLNRSVVFHSEEPLARTAVRYAACALGLVAVNTLAITVLVGAFGAPAVPAKLVVETLAFLGSWLLQNRFVFRRKAR